MGKLLLRSFPLPPQKYTFLNLHFPGEDVFVVGEVAFEECGRVEAVRAFGLAGAAIDAVFDVQHFGLIFVGQPVCRGTAADEL